MRTTLRPGQLEIIGERSRPKKFFDLATGVFIGDQDSPVVRIIWVEIIGAAEVGFDPLSHHLRKFGDHFIGQLSEIDASDLLPARDLSAAELGQPPR